MPNSFLFYDLETFGRDPRTSRIAQFAAIRTDEALNIIDEPVSIFCQPADDFLPSPTASLITGITPQFAQANGVKEAEFFAEIMQEMSQPGTCALGYNSIRFDDEFIRYGLYRNFYEPYEREYANGNSRWDLMDVMRMACALRPEGLQWPLREDGFPSFKLEDLARANETREGDAHEALSDVRALIGLAQKFKQSQPKLWDYAYSLRDKKKMLQLLDVINPQPVLHISGRLPVQNYCAALMAPLNTHPHISNRIICVDLMQDPTDLLKLNAEQIRERVFISNADLPEDMQRIALKEIHANRCPIVLPLSHVREEDFERLNIDRERCLQHWQQIQRDRHLSQKISEVFARQREFEPADADAALYEKFIGPREKALLPRVRRAAPEELASFAEQFRDERYPELLFRYRARNWPQTLSFDEIERWNDYRREKLQRENSTSEYSIHSFQAEIHALRAQANAEQHTILDALLYWGSNLSNELAIDGDA